MTLKKHRKHREGEREDDNMLPRFPARNVTFSSFDQLNTKTHHKELVFTALSKASCGLQCMKFVKFLQSK